MKKHNVQSLKDEDEHHHLRLSIKAVFSSFENICALKNVVPCKIMKLIPFSLKWDYDIVDFLTP